jgi:hypothetical protein
MSLAGGQAILGFYCLIIRNGEANFGASAHMNRSLLLSLLLVMLPFVGSGQQFRGRVYDRLSMAPLASVLVTNTRSGALWLSDSVGNLGFTAFPGDEISFTRPGYKASYYKVRGYGDLIEVALERAPVQLQGVEVMSPLARYKQDSAFNRQFFRKDLGYVKSQIGMGSGSGGPGFGVSVGGVLSELALLASGKKKEVRRFEQEMLMLEGLQYSAIRYNPALVATQTGLSDTAATAFIVRNPLPNDYLRVASELELKMRVRDMYRAERKADSLKQVH